MGVGRKHFHPVFVPLCHRYADGSAGCPTLQKTLVSFQYLLPGTSRWITIDTYPRAEFLYGDSCNFCAPDACCLHGTGPLTISA